jgi:hypothetical protein
MSLPAWMVEVPTPDGKIPAYVVNADAAYEAILAELGFDVDELTQYHLEVAYQCIKMECQRILGTFGFELRIKDPEKKWALKKFKKGRGIDAATKGKEAREHYRRIRGFIPG